MKFTRSTWITLFITAFLVAAVVLYQMYTGANKAHTLARNNLSAAQLSLSALNKQKLALSAQLTQAVADVASWNDKIALLQTELGQAKLSLTQIQSKYPASIQTIEYNETLIALAKSSNVTLQVVVATEPALGDLNNSSFNFYTSVFSISVSGKVSDILSFVDKISTNSSFSTGAISPVSFNVPLPPQPPVMPAPPLSPTIPPPPPPLDQTTVNQMRAAIKTQMIADQDASVKGADRIALIEQSFLTLLGDNSAGPTVDQMTQAIKNIISKQFSPSIGNLLANQIALAIENDLAGSLVNTIAQTYSDAISALFVNTGGLLPVFSGPLGAEITTAIQGIPAANIPGTISKVISDTLNSMVSAKIEAMVSDASIDAALQTAVNAAQAPAQAAWATQVAQLNLDYQAAQADWAAQVAQLNLDYQAALVAATPSAQLTIAVYSYKGD